MNNNPIQGQLFIQPGETIASIMGILDDGTPYLTMSALYESLGINAEGAAAITKSWQIYQERILLNDQIPVDYFSIFREMADILVRLINSQFRLDPYSVPDISVGQHWGKYWQDNNCERTFGARIKHPHYYPDDRRDKRKPPRRRFRLFGFFVFMFRLFSAIALIFDFLAIFLPPCWIVIRIAF